MKNPSLQIKAVIFDCDGTLIDSEYSHYTAWKHALRKQSYVLTSEEYCRHVGHSTKTIAERFSIKIGEDCSGEIIKDKTAHYRKLQSEGIPPIKPTIDFVQQLVKEKKKLGLTLGVASALSKREVIASLQNLGIEDCFDIVLSGADDLAGYHDPEGVNKPKPYIYLHAAKMLNLLPSECVVIEDSHTGVEAGVQAGCLTVAVPNEYTVLQDLSRAQLTIKSFTNITAKAFIEMLAR